MFAHLPMLNRWVFALLFTLRRRRITRTATSLFWSLLIVWLRAPKYIDDIDDSWNLFVHDDWVCCRSSRRSTSLLQLNISKVYAEFCDYDDATVECWKQQHKFILPVTKYGNTFGCRWHKTGQLWQTRLPNCVDGILAEGDVRCRGWRPFGTKFFNLIWRVTDVSPDRYELVLCLCVDECW